MALFDRPETVRELAVMSLPIENPDLRSLSPLVQEVEGVHLYLTRYLLGVTAAPVIVNHKNRRSR
jgi:hypothetical protein